MPSAPWDELSQLELELDNTVHVVAQSLDTLNCTKEDQEEKVLEQLALGMKKIEIGLTHIRAITPRKTTEKDHQEATIKRYTDIIKGIQQAFETIHAREAPRSTPRKYSNST
jgi:hypothetical protein